MDKKPSQGRPSGHSSVRQRQREKLMEPILEAQRQREKLMEPILEAQRQRERLMEPILEAQRRHLALVEPLKAVQMHVESLLASSQSRLVRDGLMPLADQTRQTMVAQAAMVAAMTDENEWVESSVEVLSSNVDTASPSVRLWADYIFVLVFATLLGWWLGEANRTGQVIIDMNRIEIGEHLVTFLGIAYAARKAILSIDGD